MKAIKHKITGEYMTYSPELNEWFTSDIPTLHPDGFTMEFYIEYMTKNGHNNVYNENAYVVSVRVVEETSTKYTDMEYKDYKNKLRAEEEYLRENDDSQFIPGII